MLKRYKFMIFILVVGLIATTSYFYLTKDQRAYDEILTSHIRLVVTRENQTSFGTSVIFDEDIQYYYAITNHHVVDQATKIDGVDFENNIYQMDVINSNSYYDLAVLKFEKDIDLKVLKISEVYHLNDEIKAVGYPRSIFTISSGSIDMIDVVDFDMTIQVIHHSASIDHGSSGGALLNNKNEIIGINFAANLDSQISYAIPGVKVNQYLSSIDYKD